MGVSTFLIQAFYILDKPGRHGNFVSQCSRVQATLDYIAWFVAGYQVGPLFLENGPWLIYIFSSPSVPLALPRWYFVFS